MEISVFSVLMTILWSSVFITLFYFLRTKTKMLHICSISTVILLYLFCVVRIAFPIELPWTRVVSGGMVFKGIYNLFFFHKVGSVSFLNLFLIVWFAGIVYNMSKFLINYCGVMRYIHSVIKAGNEERQELSERLDKRKHIEIVKTSSVKSPCCIGIFRKRILLPNKEYNKDELQYILLHEYMHLDNNDILLKGLIMVLCWFYWWNPIVYLLQKELDQSIEIRCDLKVTKHLKESERADYLNVMLDAFRESRQTNKYVGTIGLVDNHSNNLIERFRIVADMRVVQKSHVNMLVGFMMLVLLAASYSFILQSKFETPISEIETEENAYHITAENAYITKQGNTYIVHVAGTETIISETTAKMLVEEEGFVMKGASCIIQV